MKLHQPTKSVPARAIPRARGHAGPCGPVLRSFAAITAVVLAVAALEETRELQIGPSKAACCLAEISRHVYIEHRQQRDETHLEHVHADVCMHMDACGFLCHWVWACRMHIGALAAAA